MARGQSQAATNQLNTTNAVAGGQQGQATALENQLLPGYTSLMNTGYLSPEQEAAATETEMGAATAPFSTAKFEGANAASATRNPASLTAQQDQLALEEGQTAGTAAAELENQKMQNELAGMYGIGQQEAGNRQEAEAMYGLGPPTLQARAAGQSGDQLAQGWLNTLLAGPRSAGGGGGGGSSG